MCARKTKQKIKKKVVRKAKKRGSGFIDKLIDKLPFEVHIPFYSYCGPGTKLEKRLARGDRGINLLDSACKRHDIAYSMNSDSENRSVADATLQQEAMKRVFSKDASLLERATSLGVAAAMKAKRTLSGKGLSKKKCPKKKAKVACKKKAACKNVKKKITGKGLTKGKKKKASNVKSKVSFASIVSKAKTAIKKKHPDNVESAIEVAVRSINQSKKGKIISKPRTIKLPTVEGGVLPLIPIFAGLSALGSIVGSAAGIANAINQVRKGQSDLQESMRHNRTMEAIAIGDKTGLGFYLQPEQSGDGFYLEPYSKNE